MIQVYYNEFDKKKCSALSMLMADGHIRKGEIDDRPIQDVKPEDLKDYERCHFFAGIGLWDYALDLARWPENRGVWTGSCPCQPFSTAGRQKGKDDDRHLWPEWLRLIEECGPATVFGEQVANAISKGWLDDVYQGLEAEGYAVGSAVLPACSVGVPHKRDRLWFVALSSYFDDRGNTGEFQAPDEFKTQKRPQERIAEPSGSSPMGNAKSEGLQRHGGLEQELCTKGRETEERHTRETGVWLNCPDGKQRLVEPGICLLAHGYPERVGLLHCAGDAIVPQVAAGFIESFIDVVGEK